MDGEHHPQERARTFGGIAKDIFWTFSDHVWARTGHGYGLDMDWPKIRTVRGRGVDMDTDMSWSRSSHGLDADMFADRSRTWIVCYHGQIAVSVTDWMRTWTDHGRGCGLDMDIFTDRSRTRTGRGHGLVTSADANRTWTRTLCRTIVRILPAKPRRIRGQQSLENSRGEASV
jgi:hypothetical protein